MFFPEERFSASSEGGPGRRAQLVGRSASRTRRKAPEPRRDFLEWAQEEWPTSAELLGGS